MNQSDLLDNTIPILLFNKTIYVYPSILKKSEYLLLFVKNSKEMKNTGALKSEKDQEIVMNWIYHCYNKNNEVTPIPTHLEIVEYVEELLYRINLIRFCQFDEKKFVKILHESFSTYLYYRCMHIISEPDMTEIFVSCRHLFKTFHTEKIQQKSIIKELIEKLKLHSYIMVVNGGTSRVYFSTGDIDITYRILGFHPIKSMLLPKTVFSSQCFFHHRQTWIIDDEIVSENIWRSGETSITANLSEFLVSKWLDLQSIEN